MEYIIQYKTDNQHSLFYFIWVNVCDITIPPSALKFHLYDNFIYMSDSSITVVRLYVISRHEVKRYY